MLIPISWLKQYVPIEISALELAHRLTMAGTEISEVKEVGTDWGHDKVIIGHVLKVDPHPDADRLKIPSLDLGDGQTAQVVCGGPNLAAGQKIAFAREGATLYNAKTGKLTELKSSKIRGVISTGMVCSELELGLGEDHQGILVLPDDAPIGTPLVDYLGDAILSAEVTPNRPDCLSMLGIAHEVAALTGQTVTEPNLNYPENGKPIDQQVSINVTDSGLCPRYAVSLIRGITVKESPTWLKDAIEKAGLRSINNIVDVTNYVMLEYGQPLHAFDYTTINDSTVIIRTAHDNEELITLDDEEREINSPILTIADPKGAIALAGVMGGRDSEVTETTIDVLLESANFEAINTRKTARALGMSTEASYRYERGIRTELVPLALRRATKLILELAGGSVAKGILDTSPTDKIYPPLTISHDKFERVLGTSVSINRADEVLISLGFSTSRTEDKSLAVEAPYWRTDISIEEDLVEEVARIIGYEDVPATLLSSEIPHQVPNPSRDVREQVRDALVAAGMQETISYPATSLNSIAKVGVSNSGVQAPLPIANPISSDMTHMRTTLRPSILDTLSFNRRVSHGLGFKLFEIGKIYLPSDDVSGGELPKEEEVLIGVFDGPSSETSWLTTGNTMDFFYAKGVIDVVFRQLGLNVEYAAYDTDQILHPGKTALLNYKGNRIGVIGEIHPNVLELFDIEDATVALIEINLETLYNVLEGTSPTYTGVSRYPESERDIAILVDDEISSAQIQDIISRNKLVQSSTPFDLYTGDKIPVGKKSIGYRVTFRSNRSTLTRQLVDKTRQSIVTQLERELGAELRD